MNLSLEGIDFDIRDFENSDEKTKQLAETLDELLVILKLYFRNL